jgi:hypothetical protein
MRHAVRCDSPDVTMRYRREKRLKSARDTCVYRGEEHLRLILCEIRHLLSSDANPRSAWERRACTRAIKRFGDIVPRSLAGYTIDTHESVFSEATGCGRFGSREKDREGSEILGLDIDFRCDADLVEMSGEPALGTVCPDVMEMH